jgi:hypothetical protein
MQSQAQEAGCDVNGPDIKMLSYATLMHHDSAVALSHHWLGAIESATLQINFNFQVAALFITNYWCKLHVNLYFTYPLT